MESTFKIIYYALLVISIIVSGFLLFSSLFSTASNDAQRGRIVLILASGSALGFLYWAYRLGHQQGQFGLGIGMVVSAIVVFGLVMLVGLFTGKIHWQ
ncbi:MAG: hypothetical protein IPH31_02390 [Lewinellaceae bacterium]|nr:hypothetical protein [Lewinellaceae bacterium]